MYKKKQKRKVRRWMKEATTATLETNLVIHNYERNEYTYKTKSVPTVARAATQSLLIRDKKPTPDGTAGSTLDYSSEQFGARFKTVSISCG
ncbi:hypothetical protein EVAR_2992_1 [Eumeta japonica]|uniref:Uncharacterized protein n=1 Tax=Eumeta variegata TaxID=151549 RepID=A0A4C1SU33_EUMVA|nr:hypothetical protein EVAR_2992_1 [Eumeta japonica]